MIFHIVFFKRLSRPEEQTAANFPRRVFDQRQTQALGLGQELRQPRRPVLLKATQPFPHRWHRGDKGSGCGFDPALTGVLH